VKKGEETLLFTAKGGANPSHGGNNPIKEEKKGGPIDEKGGTI